MIMEIRDSLTVDAAGLTLTRDGFVVGEARVSRAGNVQQYYGHELGLTKDEAGKVFGVYRDPDVVFDEKSMLSLAGRPVTRGHPPGEVNAGNWKDLAKGAMGGVIKRDGEHVVASMVVMDAASGKEVMDGARFLSAGYTVSVVRDEGIAPDGTPYQFRQAGDLRFNHVAYLPDNNPRAGNTRIGDAWRDKGLAPITPSKKEDVMSDALKTVVLGDKAVQVAVTDVAAIDAFRAETAKTLSDTKAAHAAAIAVKDEEIGTLKADLKKAQDSIPTPEAMSKMVADRAALETMVKTIAKDVKTEGVSDADIRKSAVAAKLGDDMVKDASDAEIAGMFKAIAKDASTADPVRAALLNRDTTIKTNDNGQAGYEQRLRDSWKSQAKGA